MKTCTRCHIEKDESAFYVRKAAGGRLTPHCKACQCAADRARRAARSPEERAKECASRLKYFKTYRERYPEKVKLASRTHHLQRTYGLTLGEMEMYMSAQGGACLICRKSLHMGWRGFAVDHCHSSGRVRGLLCWACNVGLGFFRDNIPALQRAVAYLLKDEPVERLADVVLTSPEHVRGLIATLKGRHAREQNVLSSMAGR